MMKGESERERENENERAKREGGTNNMELFIVLAVISTSLVLLLTCTACCVVRCFRPQNSKGPAWFPDAEGNPQRVVGLFDERDDRGEGQRKGWLEKVDDEKR